MYTIRHCTVLLGQTSRSGFATASTISAGPAIMYQDSLTVHILAEEFGTPPVKLLTHKA